MNLEIANRLVELRRSHGLSQEDLAARLGVSRQAVSKWERAESSPDTDNLIALARLYRVSLDGLLLHEVEDGGTAAQAAPEPGQEDDPEDEDGDVFAAAQAWDAAEEAVRQKKNEKLRRRLLTFPYPIFITFVYLAVGFAFGWWHPGWMLYLTVPIYYCLANSV